MKWQCGITLQCWADRAVTAKLITGRRLGGKVDAARGGRRRWAVEAKGIAGAVDSCRLHQDDHHDDRDQLCYLHHRGTAVSLQRYQCFPSSIQPQTIIIQLLHALDHEARRLPSSTPGLPLCASPRGFKFTTIAAQHECQATIIPTAREARNRLQTIGVLTLSWPHHRHIPNYTPARCCWTSSTCGDKRSSK